VRAYQFMLENARLLERRAFEARFLGASPHHVAEALYAYRNPDGGLGHALEPDLRCPESQPLFVDYGLNTLREVGYRDPELCASICSYLDAVSDEMGMVPPFFDNALAFPHAPHWSSISWTGTVAFGLNPTLDICGLLHYQGVQHEWLSRATASCCSKFIDNPPSEAHHLVGATRLVDHLPDRVMANRIAELIAATLPQASYFIATVPTDDYGVTPLDFAPTPQSRWRSLFSDEQIEAHLNDLLSRQQPDGGWAITWDPPTGSAEAEFRGRRTLRLLVYWWLMVR
jgi:hypothetical protein